MKYTAVFSSRSIHGIVFVFVFIFLRILHMNVVVLPFFLHSLGAMMHGKCLPTYKRSSCYVFWMAEAFKQMKIVRNVKSSRVHSQTFLRTFFTSLFFICYYYDIKIYRFLCVVDFSVSTVQRSGSAFGRLGSLIWRINFSEILLFSCASAVNWKFVRLMLNLLLRSDCTFCRWSTSNCETVIRSEHKQFEQYITVWQHRCNV